MGLLRRPGGIGTEDLVVAQMGSATCERRDV